MSLTKLQLQKLRSTPWWDQIKRKELSPTTPFEEARAIARIQGFNSKTEYTRWAKNIAGMPVAADSAYKDKGWMGWGDFIGTGRELRSPAEHVQTAERLAQEHNGILPRGQWLHKNGFHALTNCMRAHPELFSHIPQAKKWEESIRSAHVETAERLAKEHDGILPRRVWLVEHFSGLYRYMLKHPELFSHIPQAKNRRDIKKSFEEARDLARAQEFNSHKEYQRWAKNIAGMAAIPELLYKDKGWAGWNDFLGTKQMRSRSYWLPFAEAKAVVRAHGIKTQGQLRAWPNRFANKIPLKPNRFYQNAGWINWYDFFDKETPVKTHADCHPDRKHFARGLCAKCYERKRERKRPLVAPERPPVFEREAELMEV